MTLMVIFTRNFRICTSISKNKKLAQRGKFANILVFWS